MENLSILIKFKASKIGSKQIGLLKFDFEINLKGVLFKIS